MSAKTVAQATPETTPQAAPSATESTVTNTWVQQGVQLLTPQIEMANQLAGNAEKVANSAKLVFELRDDEDTKDPTIQKFQKWFDLANNEIIKQTEAVEAYIRKNLLKSEDEPDFDEAANAEAYKALVKGIGDTVKALTMLNGGTTPDNIPEIKSLPGIRKANGNSGQTGVKRPRFDSVQYRIAGENKWVLAEMKKPNSDDKTSNLSALALILKAKYKDVKGVADISASTFHDPMFAAAGTQDIATLAGKEIVFVVDILGKNYEVQVIPAAK